jgi:tRNA(Arg) A34 adenosine deaminase TadA
MKNTNDSHEKFMLETINYSLKMMRNGKSSPFGAIITKNKIIIARGYNKVTRKNDPTAHAEIEAIREASRKLKTFHLNDCELYTTCEPCPMCLGAIYWAKIHKVYYANTKKDASNIGFNDYFIYKEIEKLPSKRKILFTQLMRNEALKIFQEWTKKTDKILY